tara:strand:+ start:4783 stop:5160 length:378 start_codon:yes stop_codon:yes gene_type:complete
LKGLELNKLNLKKSLVLFFLSFIGFMLPYDIAKYNMYSTKTFKIDSVYGYKHGNQENILNLEDYLFHRKIIDEAHPILYNDILEKYLSKFIKKENLDSIYVILKKPKFKNHNTKIELKVKNANEK